MKQNIQIPFNLESGLGIMTEDAGWSRKQTPPGLHTNEFEQRQLGNHRREKNKNKIQSKLNKRVQSDSQ